MDDQQSFAYEIVLSVSTLKKKRRDARNYDLYKNKDRIIGVFLNILIFIFQHFKKSNNMFVVVQFLDDL